MTSFHEQLLTKTISAIDDKIVLDTKSGTIIQSNGNFVARFIGVYNGNNKPQLDIHTVRGSIDNPQVLQAGDYGMNMSFTTLFELDGEDIGKSLVTFIPQVDHTADINHPAPASNLNILVNAGDGKGEYASDYRVWKLNKNGALESKIFQCVAQDAESINNIEPKNGMIIYNNETNKFQGYADGTWVDLH
jgi:hypothetical protein